MYCEYLCCFPCLYLSRICDVCCAYLCCQDKNQIEPEN